MVSERSVKANNPYLEDYDRAKPTSYIQYLDANNFFPAGRCSENFYWSD